MLAGAYTANGVVLAELVARRVGGRTATLAALVVAGAKSVRQTFVGVRRVAAHVGDVRRRRGLKFVVPKGPDVTPKEEEGWRK